MKTLEQFCESILLAHYGGEITDDAKFTIRQVAIWVMQERDAMIKMDLFNQMKEDTNSPSPDFFKEYDIVAAWDSSKHRLYLTLESKAATLPRDRGIGAVYPKGMPEKAFTRLRKNAYALVYEICKEGNDMWELVSDRRIDLPDASRTYEGKTFTVDMIPIDEAPETSLTEPVRMPGEYESMIRDRVLQIMANKQVNDDTNDNRDQT